MRTHHRFAFLCLKWIPIAIFTIMLCNTIISLFFPSFIVVDFVGCSILPSFLILVMLKIFNFCNIHKSLTVYSMCIDLMINVERYIGFGKALFPIQISLSVIGVILLFLLLKKTKFFKFIIHEKDVKDN